MHSAARVCSTVKVFLWGSASLAMGLLIAPDLSATTVKQFGLDELVTQATLIFVGKCVSRDSGWNKERTLILTTSEFTVSELLKGSTKGRVSVTTVGGTLNGITQQVTGMPDFVGDEEVLLFLQPASGSWQVLGLSQGKFRIVNNPLTGEKETVRSLSGLTLYDQRNRKMWEASKSSRVPLAELRERILTLIRK